MFDNYNIGDVIKILYIVFLRTKKKKKKMYNFIGLCTNKNFNIVTIKNNVKGEKISIMLDLKSPVLVKVLILKLYVKLSFRISRLKFLKKINKYFDDYNNKDNEIISNFYSFKYDYFHSAYLKKKIKRFKKKLRKFKKKYSYTENWKNLRVHMAQKKNVNL